MKKGGRNDKWADMFHVGQTFKLRDKTVKVIQIKKLRKEIHLRVLEPRVKKKESEQ